jgi:glutathione S-transferase
MTVRLYITSLSNPSRTAVGMLAHKRLPHRRIDLLSGFHPYLVRAAGFEGRTVPALELADGRHVQGSLQISRALDELVPERPLFPAEPVARRAVERAERWGHDELQPIPRRIFRYAAMRDPVVRRWIAADVAGVPAPAVVAALTRPVAVLRCADSGGSEETIPEDVRRLPGLLDLADALVGEGTIGGPERNAADFQILASIRLLLDFKALPSAEHRPASQAARELFPHWEGEMPAFAIPGT